jgi:hypothetical protein
MTKRHFTNLKAVMQRKKILGPLSISVPKIAKIYSISL